MWTALSGAGEARNAKEEFQADLKRCHVAERLGARNTPLKSASVRRFASIKTQLLSTGATRQWGGPLACPEPLRHAPLSSAARRILGGGSQAQSLASAP